ncbi:MAG: YdcF family protein [Bacteroidia bacterium]|jgi:SanA protein|nr:YdcF family protein [Bacteroidia bacterium]
MNAVKRFFAWLFATRLRRWGFMWLPLCGVLLIVSCHLWVQRSTQSQIYSDVNKIPARDVALVLGANPRARTGRTNLYFLYRMEAAAALYKAGKVKHIIVSGDNHKAAYDESTAMKNALTSLGVPDSCITLDYAGFRTLDSVVRCKTVFGQSSVIIVSQQFHNERALFIANRRGINAVAFNAKDVPGAYSRRTILREYLARVSAVFDVVVFNRQPKFNGPPAPIKL